MATQFPFMPIEWGNIGCMLHEWRQLLGKCQFLCSVRSLPTAAATCSNISALVRQPCRGALPGVCSVGYAVVARVR